MKILNFLTAPFLLAFTLNFALAGGDTLGNGGYIENEISFVWSLGSEIGRTCLKSSNCNDLQVREFAFLLDQAKSKNFKIEFYEIHQKPELKNLESLLIGDTILFNVTYLYTKHTDPIQYLLTDALISILKPLANSTPHPQIIKAAKKLIQLYFNNEKTVSLAPFGLENMALKFVGQNPEVALLSDAHEFVDLSPLFKKVIACEDQTDLIIWSFRNLQIQGFAVSTGKLYLGLNAKYTCQTIGYSADFLLQISLQKTNTSPGTYKVNLNASKGQSFNRIRQ